MGIEVSEHEFIYICIEAYAFLIHASIYTRLKHTGYIHVLKHFSSYV